MNKIIVDYIDNIPTCILVNDKKQKEIAEFNDFFKVIDNLKTFEVTIDNLCNKCVIKCKSIKHGPLEIEINNAGLLFTEGYFPKILKKICKKIKMNGKEKIYNTKIVNTKSVITGVATFTLLSVIILNSTINAISKNTKKEPVTDDIQIEKQISINTPIIVFEEPKYTSQNIVDDLPEIGTLDNPIVHEIHNTFIDVSLQKYDQEKMEYAWSNYKEIVCEQAEKWGLDSRLMMSILCQESGGLDNAKQNIFQISNALDGQVFISQNFITNSLERVLLTSDHTIKSDDTQRVIYMDQLDEPRINAEVACHIFRMVLSHYNNNIFAGITAYNQGIGNMNTILEETSKQTGLSIEEILNNHSDIIFKDYTYASGVGDPDYLNNVLAYMPIGQEGCTDIRIKNINSNKEFEVYNVNMVLNKDNALEFDKGLFLK